MFHGQIGAVAFDFLHFRHCIHLHRDTHRVAVELTRTPLSIYCIENDSHLNKTHCVSSVRELSLHPVSNNFCISLGINGFSSRAAFAQHFRYGQSKFRNILRRWRSDSVTSASAVFVLAPRSYRTFSDGTRKIVGFVRSHSLSLCVCKVYLYISAHTSLKMIFQSIPTPSRRSINAILLLLCKSASIHSWTVNNARRQSREERQRKGGR